MLGHDDGLARRFQRRHHLGEALHGGHVQGGRRLVQHEHRRLHGEGRGDGHRLLLAAGKLLDAAIEQIGDPQGPGRLGHPRHNLAAGKAQVLAAEGDLGGHVQVHELAAGVLEHRTHAHAQLVGSPGGHLRSLHHHAALHLAGIDMGHQAVDEARERGLTATGGAGDHHALAPRNLEEDPAQHRPLRAGVGVGHILEDDGGRCGRWGRGAHGSTFPATAAATSATAATSTTTSSAPMRSSW